MKKKKLNFKINNQHIHSCSVFIFQMFKSYGTAQESLPESVQGERYQNA